MLNLAATGGRATCGKRVREVHGAVASGEEVSVSLELNIADVTGS